MANHFLIKNSMEEMKNLSPDEIAWLQGAYPVYSGVKLLGYYSAGDTPEPIIYYLASTDPGPANDGSVIAVGGNKLVHTFIGNVNVLYFGAQGVASGGQPPYPDDYQYLQNALNYCAGKGKCISLPGRKFYTSKTLSIPHNSIGGGIVSEQGSNSYIKSCVELMSTATDLYTIRNYSQGTTLKDVAVRGRSVGIENSVAVLFKRVEEYPNSGDAWKDDLENNIDAVVEGCDFGNAETHLEFWGRQVTVKHNTFSGGHNAMVFKQSNTLGKYGGSARGYRVWNNFFHSFDSGNANRDKFALINNKTTDGYGFDFPRQL